MNSRLGNPSPKLLALTQENTRVDHDVCERDELSSNVRRCDLGDVHRGHHEPAPYPQPRQQSPDQQLHEILRHRHAPSARDKDRAS